MPTANSHYTGLFAINKKILRLTSKIKNSLFTYECNKINAREIKWQIIVVDTLKST